MYEQMRNDFLRIALDSGMQPEEAEQAVRVLDLAATKYEISHRELGLVPYNDELPELAKTYLVCKKIEGLTDRTLENYMRNLKIFFTQMHKPVEQITANDIRMYLFAYQQERGCTNRTLDKYRGYLASFFAWAAGEDYLPKDPMRMIPPIKYESKPRQNLTQLELEYLREACRTPRERAIVEFLYSTGCRVSELSGVKKSDIDWQDKSVHLFGKGRKHRTSFLNAKSEVSLRAYLETREDECGYLFVSERKPYRQLKKEAVEKIIRNLSQRAKENTGKNVTPHVLRHTTATTALQNGMPIEEISKLLGHESIDTTMIYAHTSLEAVREGHRKYII